MVFKRRDKLSWGRWIIEAFYPRSGWKRAASYVVHRLRRLPDTPHKIARGIAFGVVVSFTPFFGLHFVLAAGLAMLFRGNIIAAVLGTFFGNPLTFPFIAAIALTLGNWMLGTPNDPATHESVLMLFAQATGDFWFNFEALFTSRVADWTALQDFFMRVTLPYFLGGIGPGIVSATIVYFLSLPIITVYKNRRKGRLAKRRKERGVGKVTTAPKKADDGG